MSSDTVLDDLSAMNRALELARQGIGLVEPNPAVGAVITDAQGRMIATGYHRQFGGPHAEIEALRTAGDRAQGATIFVTLEPCSHQGKTPPCVDALIAAGIRKVVVATQDPAPHVAGQGIARLRSAGIDVEIGLCAASAQELIAPFRKLFTTGVPYIHAKWAMTLDGKIASRTGSSKWISGELSRQVVHRLRGRMDAILTGIGTVLADDPQLTVRPAGLRVPLRVVLDSLAQLSVTSHLVQTIDQAPVLLVVGPQASEDAMNQLQGQGVEVLQVEQNPTDGRLDLPAVLHALGQRQLTNVLLEAGGKVLGSFWDGRWIDEIHCFIAPKLLGGTNALSPVGGLGLETMEQSIPLRHLVVERLDTDLYVRGRIESTN